MFKQSSQQQPGGNSSEARSTSAFWEARKGFFSRYAAVYYLKFIKAVCIERSCSSLICFLLFSLAHLDLLSCCHSEEKERYKLYHNMERKGYRITPLPQNKPSTNICIKYSIIMDQLPPYPQNRSAISFICCSLPSTPNTFVFILTSSTTN